MVELASRAAFRVFATVRATLALAAPAMPAPAAERMTALAVRPTEGLAVPATPVPAAQRMTVPAVQRTRVLAVPPTLALVALPTPVPADQRMTVPAARATPDRAARATPVQAATDVNVRMSVLARDESSQPANMTSKLRTPSSLRSVGCSQLNVRSVSMNNARTNGLLGSVVEHVASAGRPISRGLRDTRQRWTTSG